MCQHFYKYMDVCLNTKIQQQKIQNFLFYVVHRGNFHKRRLLKSSFSFFFEKLNRNHEKKEILIKEIQLIYKKIMYTWWTCAELRYTQWYTIVPWKCIDIWKFTKCMFFLVCLWIFFSYRGIEIICLCSLLFF